ncbi:MAG: hypothetical protein HYX96_00790 [Chloroflexi bacterium]|nr:hypothetical protein [Chloroflexota bacterium]
MAFLGLGMAQSQQGKEKASVSQELALTNLKLDRLPIDQLAGQREQLEGKLSAAEANLARSRDYLRQPVDEIEVTGALFRISVDSSVDIVEITSPGLGVESFQGTVYSVLILNVRATGDTGDLIGFIKNLTLNFTTGAIQRASINVPAGDEEPPILDLKLSIYAYQDAS